jgi:chromosome segregation ATPase
MKRTILMAIISVSSLIFMVACSSGVSQEQYKKATDDLSAAQSLARTLQTQLTDAQSQAQSTQTQLTDAQSQIQSLQTNLTDAQSQTKSLQTQLSTSLSQTQSLQTQLTDAQSQTKSLQTQFTNAQSQTQSIQSDLQSAKSKISRAQLVAGLLDSIMQTYLNMETMSAVQALNTYMKWTTSVKAIGDSELSTKFDLVINATTSAAQDKASNDFMFYLIALESKILQ